ncbi:MAG TPA: excinuclease ABC subunit A [Bacteroidales bacterium]|nr:excinuclease ABC subunit A [Bacteroidales bacterium]
MNGNIEIKGARVHNLKDITLDIPRNKLIVITGVSGSGKSSLAFDTIYAEGQRRYVESLSSYARQFLGRMNKPEVDFINGIPPAIAIEQKVNTRNPRSTVGTSTEIHDYLRLLWARVGRTVSPVSGREVRKHTVDDVVNYLATLTAGTRVVLTAPLAVPENVGPADFIKFLLQQGYNRISTEKGLIRLDEQGAAELVGAMISVDLIIDRFAAGSSDEDLSRAADSVQTAFMTGRGHITLTVTDEETTQTVKFSDKFEEDGISFEEPTEHLFSFNSPLGACPVCEGYGKVLGIDENLVIPDENLSVYEDAIACWRGETMKQWKERLIYSADKFGFPIHKPWYKLTPEQKAVVWNGNKYFFGLNRFFEHLEEKKYKIQYRVMLSRYRGKRTCPECNGERLRKEATYVKVGGRAITEITSMPVIEAYRFFETIVLNGEEKEIAGRLLKEIQQRLGFLVNVGLSYLTLDRLSNTLSGGEAQRINLATSLGSSLVGSLYILDEPSIGLHPRDTNLLVNVLKELRDLGNTVIVVEHEEEVIRNADMIIDMGPAAGAHGGEIIYQGGVDFSKKNKSLTAAYMTGAMRIEEPAMRRKWHSYIGIRGARANNLKDIDVKFPLHTITTVTGVSGSGKSTLVHEILFNAIAARLGNGESKPGRHSALEGDISSITAIELIDQNPIGKSTRSNPVTYLKAFDDIRKLFAEQQAAVQSGFKPAHFSFNVEGGRCEECQGEGIIRVEMQFMADVELTCEACKGMRYKRDILDVKYNGKNIYEVLEMTIDEAIEFFGRSKDKTCGRIAAKLRPLADVGLGYVRLGQSSSTLSGGESQRVKLAYYLSQEKSEAKMLFIFDEPTTGLHFHDISKLMKSLNALVDHGHSVLLIEHNVEVIKCSDWVIDLGPEGGEKGGFIVFEGTPEQLAGCENSYTGRFLRRKINGSSSLRDQERSE